MKFLTSSSVFAASLLSAGIFLSVDTPRSLAATFRTTLTLDDVDEQAIVDTVIHEWSLRPKKNKNEVATAIDLRNWTYQLWNEGTLVYSEDIIAKGKVQPLSNIPRSFLDINIRLNLNAVRLEQFDSDVSNLQVIANGLTYQISGTEETITLTRSINRIVDEFFTGSFEQSTRQIPEPLTILGVTMAVGLGGVFKSRVHQKSSSKNKTESP